MVRVRSGELDPSFHNSVPSGTLFVFMPPMVQIRYGEDWAKNLLNILVSCRVISDVKDQRGAKRES